MSAVKKTKLRIEQSSGLSADAARCRRKFLHYVPRGFQDDLYIDWERGYKWEAHQGWAEQDQAPAHGQQQRGHNCDHEKRCDQVVEEVR